MTWLVQGHMARKRWSQDLNQGCLVAEALILTIM